MLKALLRPISTPPLRLAKPCALHISNALYNLEVSAFSCACSVCSSRARWAANAADTAKSFPKILQTSTNNTTTTTNSGAIHRGLVDHFLAHSATVRVRAVVVGIGGDRCANILRTRRHPSHPPFASLPPFAFALRILSTTWRTLAVAVSKIASVPCPRSNVAPQSRG